MMMKMLIIIINIMNKSQETMFLAPELDFRYETKAKKVIVNFKFDALYRYVFIAWSRVSKKVNQKFVLVSGAVHVNLT